MTSAALSLDVLGLAPEAAASLPEGVRRQVVRFLLRWGRADLAGPLLPARDVGPRDRFDRCRVLIARGELEAARDLARDLVNQPEAGPWGHRAVGEVFLAMERPHRADERFRAGEDSIGRARAWLALQDPAAALRYLEGAPHDEPEVETVRLAALETLGGETEPVRAHLRALLEEEQRELLEAVGVHEPAGPLPSTPEELTEALQRVFGFDHFRAGQVDVILPLLRGESVLGLMPTGAGKSVCFQLPAALLPGATVVISPLIALMKDQVDGLPPRLYRRATLINSALEPGEADRRLEAVARGEVSLIYAAPERLRQRGFVRALQRRGVSLFVIDEAHCVSLWGHDFRPDYFFIRQVLQDLGRPTVLALTATATEEMQDDIGRQLDVRLRRVNLGTFRPNLRFQIRKLPDQGAKWAALLELLREEKGPAIVYVDRRKLAEELAAKLAVEGIPAEAYHAGMDKEARDRAQNRFMLGETRVIAATVAFGMGVDKADVRLVVHFNLPRSVEAYYQEAGRAGRDGHPARCVLLYTGADKGNLTRRTNSDRLQAGEIYRLYRVIADRLRRDAGPVSASEVEQAVGGESTRLRVGISLLQRLGALDRGYDLPSTAWLARANGAANRSADPSRQRFEQFTQALGLQNGGLSLPIERVARAAGLPVPEVEAALLDWAEAGWLRYRPGSRGMDLRAGGAAPDLTGRVNRVIEKMSELDTRRLEQLAKLLDTDECRQRFVSRYFGADLSEGCGVCDNCTRVPEPAGAGRVRERRAELDTSLATDEESALFERLRAWRRERAREDGVPAYVIFHDRVLYAIARAQPRSVRELGQVPGIGSSKLQAYGEEIVSQVRAG